MQDLKAQWERSVATGQPCVLTKRPTRAILDELGTNLGASFEPAWTNASTGEAGGPYFTVRQVRLGLIGYWDRLSDAANS